MMLKNKFIYLIVLFAFILSGVLFFSVDLFSKREMEVDVARTSDGSEYWLIEDDYLPIVSVRISFPFSGSGYDPKDKKGLAYMTASLLDEGAGEYNANEFHRELENIATSLSFWVDKDYFYVSLKTLSEHLPRSLELLSDALLKPRFDEDAIARVRNQIMVSILSQEQNPNAIAAKKINRMFFGNHPYEFPIQGEIETLKNISKDDLNKFISEKFISSNMYVSVVGDVKKNNISSLLDLTFKEIKKSSFSENNPLPTPVTLDTKKEIHFEMDVPQTVIYFISAAPQRNGENFYAMYLLNYILGGGGFESRLMNEIREKQGLVYSVNSSFSYHDEAGFIIGSAATKNKDAHKTVNAIKQEYIKLRESGVLEQELADAKSYMIHSFPLKMTKNEYLASFLDVMQRQDLGSDFLQKRNEMVEAVTVDEVNRMAEQWMDVEKLSFVTVGKSQEGK